MGHIVVYTVVALVAILIFYFGYKAVFGVTQTQESSMIELLKLQQKADVSRISTDQKAIMSFAYQLPSDYNEFCFVDLTRKNQLNMSYLMANYPVIYNSVESGTDYNAFLIGKDTIAYNVGSIRVDCAPHFACFNKTGTRLLYKLKGMGTYATPDICAEIANKPPYFTNTTPSDYISIKPGSTQEFKAKAIDPEGSKLDIKWTVELNLKKSTNKTENNVASGSMTNVTHLFPDAGTYYVVVQATDNQSLSGYHTFRVSTTGVIIPEFSCYLSTSSSCGSVSDTLFISLSGDTNAHASLLLLPDYKPVCCKAVGATLSQGCLNPTTSAPFYLSGETNAHASLSYSSSYGTPVCISSNMGTVNCHQAQSPSGCAGDEQCIVKLSAADNAHLSNCDSNYPTSICCKIT